MSESENIFLMIPILKVELKAVHVYLIWGMLLMIPILKVEACSEFATLEKVNKLLMIPILKVEV